MKAYALAFGERKNMDIPVEKLNTLFLPYDPEHLVLMWAVMTVFLFMVALIISSSGIYPTRRNFWNVEILVLAGAYLLSAVSFLLFHINAIFTIMVMVCIAFVILGDVGHKEKDTTSEDGWISMFSAKEHSHQDLEL